MTPAFPAKNVVNLALIALLVWLHFGSGGVLPVAAGPISVLVVEETSDRGSLTPGQRGIMFSHAPGSMIDWLKTHGEKEGDSLRIVDKDDSMAQDEPKWQAAFNAKGDGLPWLVVTRGGNVLLSELLPKDEADTTRDLKRLGGQ